jgi:hypothetical protein
VSPAWNECWLIVPIWCLLYGLALHAAGFFTPKGLQRFGWLFLITGGLLLVGLGGQFVNPVVAAQVFQPHWLMGGVFGGGHLAYGIYLYFTEKRGQPL